MNPVLLVNALLFISIFLFVKACFSYVTEDNKLQQPSIETEIKIFDESDLLRDRIRKLKRENTVLRDRLDRTDRKHKKRQNISSSVPPFTFEPFKINVDFLDVKKDEDEVKVDVKDETKVDVKEEVKEVKDEAKDEFKDEVKDEVKEEVKEFKDEIDDNKLSLDLEKIITDAINDMINSHDMFKERDGFAILSPIPSTPANTDDDDDEDN